MPNSKSKKSTTKNNMDAPGRNDSMLQEFFVNNIKDLYWVEKHLVKALTKMEKESTTEELKQAFADHRGVTEEHVRRLEEVFTMLDKKPVAKKCEAMEGLLKEGEEVIEETEKGTATRDVGLIIGGQKVEHYEIAAYGSLVVLSQILGLNDITPLLQQTLDEEKETDVLLTQIAENNINYMAATEEEVEA